MSEWINAEEYCVSVFDGTHDTPKVAETGYKLVTSKNILSNTLDLNSAYFISEEDFVNINKRSKVKQYDILFSMIGTVGSLYFETSDTIDYAIKNIGVFSSGDKEKAEWLYYYLQSSYAQQYIKRYLNGAVQKFLPLKGLREFPVPQFNKELHNRIKILLNIDKKIQINNQINQELEAMAKTLYDYWFVQFDFPDQNGKPYKLSGGKMVYHPELKREIPEGWGVESVGNLLDKVTKAEKIENNSIEFVGRIPVIDQSQKYIAGFTNNQSSLIQPQNGHVIFGDHTRVVKFINFDYARGADGTQVLISNNENISNILLYHMIEDFDLSNYGYARHFKFLKEKLVIVPDKKISLKFANKADVIYKKIRNNIFENQELNQLRDWLLPMLMNGQVYIRIEGKK